eukprot:3624484-Amphidinium_carterae.1
MGDLDAALGPPHFLSTLRGTEWNRKPRAEVHANQCFLHTCLALDAKTLNGLSTAQHISIPLQYEKCDLGGDVPFNPPAQGGAHGTGSWSVSCAQPAA